MATGKNSRPRYHIDDDRETKHRKKQATNYREIDNKELIVYRILCPDEVIGSVIGKNGQVIKSVREETRAKVKVVDPFPDCRERVINIYCYVKEKVDISVDEVFDDRHPLCPAQAALLMVHSTIVNAVAAHDGTDNMEQDYDECQILVPSSQTANIIGKCGSNIKKMRQVTNADIKVMAKDVSDPTHSCAMDFDNFVLISGDPKSVKEALFVISTIMYKFSPKEEIPLNIVVPVLGSSHTLHFSSTDPVVPPGFAAKTQSEQLTVKVLCPSDKIGRVIGKGGSSINNIRQSTGALIDIVDAKGRGDDCVITVSSTESMGDLKSMAVEAVLLLQEKINDEDEKSISMRFLVSSKVIGCIFGIGGSILNEIRKRTKAEIRIYSGEDLKHADPIDELVEVQGEVGRVRDALAALVLRLRDNALKEWEGSHDTYYEAAPTYSGDAGISMASIMPNNQPMSPVRYKPRNESGSSMGFRSSNDFHRYRSMSKYDDAYGARLSPYSSRFYREIDNRFPAPSTLEMIIPAYAVDKVIGRRSSNLASIRRISGASIEVVSDSRSTRGDLIFLISGTFDQKRTAENLIQAFSMAT